MSLVYALIARQQSVLCEHTDRGTGGNFATITHAVLKHLVSQSDVPARSVFPYNDYNFFFLSDGPLMYICMGEQRVPSNVAFTMLNEMKTLFLQQYGDRVVTAIAYGMAPFSSTIATLMRKYDNLKLDTPLAQVRQKMEKVKMIMIDNVNQLMERGEKIDLLVTRTDKLHQDALQYEKTAKQLKNVYWWKNIKYVLYIALAFGLLLFVLSLLVCGFDYSTCSARWENHAKDAGHRLDRLTSDTVDSVNKATGNTSH